MKNAAIALVIAVIANYAWSVYSEHQKEKEPPTNWLYVQNLNVADGISMDPNIPVVYNRAVRRPFVGQWFAEVKNADTQALVCNGSGTNFYEPKDTIPESSVTLDWFIGKPCPLPSGQYYIETTYKIKPDSYPEKTYQVVSNIFTVK